MTMDRVGRPGVVAITFSARGGGIAAVSRLLQEAITDAVGTPCRTWTLSDSDDTFDTSIGERLAFGGRITKAQIAGECDWLFYSHLSLATIQGMLPGLLGRPYAVFLHDIEAWEPLSPFRRRVLAGAFLRLANSRYTARRVAAANPGCGAVIACPLALPSGWETAASDAPLAHAMGSEAVVILGRMIATERYKGHDQLLEAWPRVVAARPQARLLCVGEGDDVPRLRTKAESLGIGGHVDFPGFVSDAVRRSVYKRAAVFAMPSRREGFGLVYLEAMASRLPCIGSTHDAASDVIVDNVTGFLVAQDDADGLAGRLVQLLADEPLRRRMGEAGHERYLSEFTYEAFRRRLISHIVEARMEPRDVTTGADVAAGRLT